MSRIQTGHPSPTSYLYQSEERQSPPVCRPPAERSRFDVLQPLYLGEGALSDLCRRWFKAIQNSHSSRRSGEKVLTVDDSTMAKVIRADGGHITALSLDFRLHNVAIVVSRIQRYCRNLKKLHVGKDEYCGLAHLLTCISIHLTSLSLN